MKDLDNLALAERIIIESGMCSNALYYAGKGAIYSDFIYNNTLTLNNIYNGLILHNRQSEFVKFVMSFDNLNAYDFIVGFYFFARNNFRFEGINNLKRKYLIQESDNHTEDETLIPDETDKIKEAFKESIRPKRKALVGA